MEVIPLLDLLEMDILDYQPVVENHWVPEDQEDQEDQVMLEGLLHQKVMMADRAAEAAEEPEPLEHLVKVEMVEMEEHQLLINQDHQQLTLEAAVEQVILQTLAEMVDLVAVAQEATDLVLGLMLLEMEVAVEELEEITPIMPPAVMEVMD